MRVALAICCLAAMAAAQDGAASLDSILARLGDDDYQVRQSAQRELEAGGREMLEPVVASYARVEDAEARLRLRAYLRDYFRRYVLAEHEQLRGPGFLGVGLNQVMVDERSVVRVDRVLGGTTAARMGLAVGDVVVSFGGRAVSGDGAAGELVREIQSTAPGSEIRLTVERAGQALELAGVLDAKPMGLMDAEEQLRREAAIGELYDQWWSEHVGGEGDPAGATDARPWEEW